jgi:hypothetical protein
MPAKKLSHLTAAARAREGKVKKGLRNNPDDECEWEGGVNHVLSSDSGTDWTKSDSDSDPQSDFSELEGQELVESLQSCLEKELEMLGSQTPYEKVLIRRLTLGDWKKAEGNRGFGYTGNSDRSKRRKEQQAREKAKQDEVLRQRYENKSLLLLYSPI